MLCLWPFLFFKNFEEFKLSNFSLFQTWSVQSPCTISLFLVSTFYLGNYKQLYFRRYYILLHQIIRQIWQGISSNFKTNSVNSVIFHSVELVVVAAGSGELLCWGRGRRASRFAVAVYSAVVTGTDDDLSIDKSIPAGVLRLSTFDTFQDKFDNCDKLRILSASVRGGLPSPVAIAGSGTAVVVGPWGFHPWNRIWSWGPTGPIL